MSCKYCGKEIPKGGVWYPDENGNGYHYKCLIKMELDRTTGVKKVSLDRVKQARGEMYEASHADADGCNTVIYLEDALDIFDRLIAESEDKE